MKKKNLFNTKLNASKKFVELTDAEVQSVSGGGMNCSACPDLH